MWKENFLFIENYCFLFPYIEWKKFLSFNVYFLFPYFLFEK